jgi:non-ribosomal peptide synthetase component E (peptide arylation enzyme)
MVSLVSFLDENARRQPDHLACVVGDDSLSYAELRDASCRFAAARRSETGVPLRSARCRTQ